MGKLLNNLSKIFTIFMTVLFLAGYIFFVQQASEDPMFSDWKFLLFTSQLIMSGVPYDAIKLLPKADVDWKDCAKKIIKLLFISVLWLGNYVAVFSKNLSGNLRMAFFLAFIVGAFWIATQITQILQSIKDGLKKTNL